MSAKNSANNIMKSFDVRAQTVGEEIANTAIHATALMLILTVAILAWPAPRAGSVRVPTPAIAVYLSTMVLLYATSALYHGLPPGRGKRLLMKLDYCVIYLFIAGSYTPFAVGVLAAHGGNALLIAIWTLAGGGVALQLLGKLSHPFLSTGFYLAMGWAVLAVAWPLFTLLPRPGVAWLVAGGLCYTGGVAFFLLDSRLRFAHSMWHLAVLEGSGCHFIAIARYA
jgi:hemolysin III